MVPAQEQHVLKLERMQRIPNKIVPDFEDLHMRKEEIQLTIPKERREIVDFITIYKLRN